MSGVNGHTRGRKRGILIYFDPDHVDAIKDWMNQGNAASFSEAVRTLVEWGLEAEGEE
ncbi:MAG: hypothetical protein AAGC57_20745 [Pseudomonadota bacterium]